MGLIPQSFIDELIARADIVEVVGSRVQLKKQGREYKACCPFHNEKTPSFWVSPEKQFYHCFGCGAHGTVIRFLMEHDKLPFVEAVEEIAGRLGLEVPREAGAAAAPRRPLDSLFDVMGRVAEFYAQSLSRSERARRYLERRGLTPEIVQRFRIGYAPDSWNEVLRRFGSTPEARRQLAELGLIIERERDGARQGERYYDRFRDRIMFPIRDVRGRVIAFGGRIIDAGEPKYLNSPETTLFHKGRELYGSYEVRQNRAPLKRLLIVEGYLDVVRLHQYGIQYAVATLGTATTADHLRNIFKAVSEVTFAFDGDRAGRAAAWRALQNALPEAQEGRELRFLFLPEGHDPDTLVAEEGPEAFEQRVEAALPLSEYLVRELRERIPARGKEGLARVVEHVKPLLEKVPEGVYRRLLLERLAEGFAFQRTPEELEVLLGVRSGVSRLRGTAPVSAGRGSLVRQSIARLLWFPEIATQVSPAERGALERVHEPGIELLRELIDNLQASPAQLPAQVIERWADKPERSWLEKLLRREEVITGAAAAAGELRAALVKLGELADTQRLHDLQEKSRTVPLSAAEKLEFQRLIQRPRGGASPR